MIIEMQDENLKDINKSNQPFTIIGKIIPTFIDGTWSFTECLYESPYEKIYPNDEGPWESYINNPNRIVFLYYAGNKCVGQVRLRKNWNNYAYIEDITVSKNHRSTGIGKQLIQKSTEWARENNMCGVMLETQDNNLLACRFYHKMGFIIGAVDTMLYANFDNADEKAVFWYLKFKR
ncbi:MAG: GNAT family N-acetyltransferase [Defluviitaleaceae bacterium]|nr:GNAT family N-acetyltransferase [Defluviitaleaceae bacterium]MCL2238635.1 GNAT family N-acetyltransferase [Defluviitaleaceae bacterium]